MKILVTICAFTLLNLNASQFITQSDLDASLHITATMTAVKTIYATNLELGKVTKGDSYSVEHQVAALLLAKGTL